MRRKKISGISTSNLAPALTVALGYIAANFANGILGKVAVLNSPIAKAGVKLGLGLYLAGNKSPMVKGVGTGIIVNAVSGVVGTVVPSLGTGVNGMPSMEGLRIQSAYNNNNNSDYKSKVIYE